MVCESRMHCIPEPDDPSEYILHFFFQKINLFRCQDVEIHLKFMKSNLF